MWFTDSYFLDFLSPKYQISKSFNQSTHWYHENRACRKNNWIIVFPRVTWNRATTIKIDYKSDLRREMYICVKLTVLRFNFCQQRLWQSLRSVVRLNTFRSKLRQKIWQILTTVIIESRCLVARSAKHEDVLAPISSLYPSPAWCAHTEHILNHSTIYIWNFRTVLKGF